MKYKELQSNWTRNHKITSINVYLPACFGGVIEVLVGVVLGVLVAGSVVAEVVGVMVDFTIVVLVIGGAMVVMVVATVVD